MTGHRCIEKSKRKMQRVVVGTGAPPRLSLRHGKRGIVRFPFRRHDASIRRKKCAWRCVLSQSVSFAREFSAGKKTSPVFFVVADSRTGIETNGTFFSEKQKSISVQIFRRQFNPCPQRFLSILGNPGFFFPKEGKNPLIAAAQRSADNHLSEYVDRNGQSLAAGADNFIRLYHKAFYFS